MNLDAFISHIKKFEIPPKRFTPSNGLICTDEIKKRFMVAGEYGMWGLVYKEWVVELSKWIGKKKVLEVMAGKGWLAKALNECGVKVKATDKNHNSYTSKIKPVYPVERIGGIKAVKKYYKEYDILLISWSPLDDPTIIDICKIWGSKKPIIYIGENDGGCNAPSKFFKKFKEIKTPYFRYKPWFGIHDDVLIGYYKE